MAKVSTPKITPFLWFNKNAEEAIKFYTSIFKNSKIIELHPLVSTFELEGQRFMALNGGPHDKFTDAISLFVTCDTQDEIDIYWKKLLKDGGKEVRCGWLTDKFGLSWQIVPTILGKLMSGPNPKKSERVMQALLKMVKLDIKKLKQAYEKQ
jgi:predicted 3-demethylubiquinone-9 3-methyltransferase (glyoxalase superfamily)